MRSQVKMLECSVHSLAVSEVYQLPYSHDPAMGMPSSIRCAVANILSDLAVIFSNCPFPNYALKLKRIC